MITYPTSRMSLFRNPLSKMLHSGPRFVFMVLGVTWAGRRLAQEFGLLFGSWPP